MRNLAKLLLPVLLFSACWIAGASAYADKAPTHIAWHDDIDAAFTAAKTSGKPVMVVFYAEWCNFCQQMEAETFPDPTVIAASAKFECAKVDGDKDPKTMEKYGVKGFPSTLFLDSGQELLRDEGFAAPPVFVAKMKLALDNRKLLKELPTLQASLAANPNDAAAAARLGHILLVLAQTDKASPLLNRAADLDKDGKLGLLPDVRLDRAICEVRKEDTAAVSHLKAWLDDYPQSSRRLEARYNYALAQTQAGQLLAALNDFDAVIVAAPQSLEAALATGYARAIRDHMAPARGG